MMEIAGFGLHYRAFNALSQLPEADQAAIRVRLETLAKLPPSEWPARVVRRPGVTETLYVIPIDGGWRILISARPGRTPEVADIVHHETLQWVAGVR
jgi:hypothetical protein